MAPKKRKKTVVEPEDDPTRKAYTKMWKAKTPTSMRTVASFVKLEEHLKQHCVSDSTRRRIKRKERKMEKMYKIPVSDMAIPSALASGMSFESPPDLLIIETNDKQNGAVHWIDESNRVFSCMVIPREQVLKHCKSKRAEVISALKSLQRTEKNTPRGTGKQGVSSCGAKYTIDGSKANQGGKGFVYSKSCQRDTAARDSTLSWAGRLKHLADAWLPTALIRAVCQITKDGAWEPYGNGSCDYSAALAASIDFSAPAHLDDDFLFSLHQLNVDAAGYDDQDAPVAQYFCFPQYGYAVALRPGDMLLFNSQCYHCLSKVTNHYVEADIRVHVTTFYLKTAHVGKNNNSVPLTEEELQYYNMSFNSNFN